MAGGACADSRKRKFFSFNTLLAAMQVIAPGFLRLRALSIMQNTKGAKGTKGITQRHKKHRTPFLSLGGGGGGPGDGGRGWKRGPAQRARSKPPSIPSAFRGVWIRDRVKF